MTQRPLCACHDEPMHVFGESWTCAVKNREYVRAQYHRRRAFVLQLKEDGACLNCGTEDPRVLDFHHRDPSNKLFKISAAGRFPLRLIKAEVAKCDLLCANCHRIADWEVQAA